MGRDLALRVYRIVVGLMRVVVRLELDVVDSSLGIYVGELGILFQIRVRVGM